MTKKTFKTKLQGRGPNNAWTFMPIPFSAEKEYGKRSRIAVKGLVNGFEFRGSIMPVGDGSHEMMFPKILQAGANAVAGDTVTVQMELDTAARVVTPPADLLRAWGERPGVLAAFKALSYTRQKEFVDWVESAKRPETRQRRVHLSVELILAGQPPRA